MLDYTLPNGVPLKRVVKAVLHPKHPHPEPEFVSHGPSSPPSPACEQIDPYPPLQDGSTDKEEAKVVLHPTKWQSQNECKQGRRLSGAYDGGEEYNVAFDEAEQAMVRCEGESDSCSAM